MTLPEHIAEAVLELLKSIPSPDKADLEVCIRRALEAYEESLEDETMVIFAEDPGKEN